MGTHTAVTKCDMNDQADRPPDIEEIELRGILRDAVSRCPSDQLPALWALLGAYVDQGYIADLGEVALLPQPELDEQ